jgi:hypothetical protein
MKKLELKSSLATIGVLFMTLLLLGSCTKKRSAVCSYKPDGSTYE